MNAFGALVMSLFSVFHKHDIHCTTLFLSLLFNDAVNIFDDWMVNEHGAIKGVRIDRACFVVYTAVLESSKKTLYFQYNYRLVQKNCLKSNAISIT
jgi:hypothetical protein